MASWCPLGAVPSHLLPSSVFQFYVNYSFSVLCEFMWITSIFWLIGALASAFASDWSAAIQMWSSWMLTYWLEHKYTKLSLKDWKFESDVSAYVLFAAAVVSHLSFHWQHIPLAFTLSKFQHPDGKGHSAFLWVFQSSHASAAKAQPRQCYRSFSRLWETSIKKNLLYLSQ